MQLKQSLWSQDIARLTFIALRNAKIDNKPLTFAGPRAWTTQEVKKAIYVLGFEILLQAMFIALRRLLRRWKFPCAAADYPFSSIKISLFFLPFSFSSFQVITLCERLAGQDANVTTVPVSVLKLTRQLTRFFQWTNDVADRLAFSEVSFPFMVPYYNLPILYHKAR